jgi:hypothetical protein
VENTKTARVKTRGMFITQTKFDVLELSPNKLLTVKDDDAVVGKCLRKG